MCALYDTKHREQRDIDTERGKTDWNGIARRSRYMLEDGGGRSNDEAGRTYLTDKGG